MRCTDLQQVEAGGNFSALSFTPTLVLPIKKSCELASYRVDLILRGHGKSNATILGQYFWQRITESEPVAVWGADIFNCFMGREKPFQSVANCVSWHGCAAVYKHGTHLLNSFWKEKSIWWLNVGCKPKIKEWHFASPQLFFQPPSPPPTTEPQSSLPALVQIWAWTDGRRQKVFTRTQLGTKRADACRASHHRDADGRWGRRPVSVKSRLYCVFCRLFTPEYVFVVSICHLFCLRTFLSVLNA